MKTQPKAHGGTVYLVGAGPGDPGLLTLRGAELIRRADVLVYDALVSADLLRLRRPDAELIYAGKRAKKHAIPQGELNDLLVRKARKGACVVRLKGGDPYVFGRGGEEAATLAAAGVSFEVVPGITSAIAAPNYAGIPVTHRECCSSFMVITGHEDDTKSQPQVDWAAVARVPGTKVILMGVERMGWIADELVRGGLAPDTPVAMIRWGTLSSQRTVEGTLADIAQRAAAAGMEAPAVTIVGGVVGFREQLNWFERRPFFGQRMVVTRTRDQASQLSERLAERGAEVLEIPTIRITDPPDKHPLVEALSGLGEYDWIVFTSPNGVTRFFTYFWKAFDDIRALGSIRFAAVGPATAAKLKELHLRVDAMPEAYVAAGVATAIAAYESVENLRILLLRAEVANRELPKLLEDMGAIVDDIACYQTVPETDDLDGAAASLIERGADWVTFASSSAVENFDRRFGLAQLAAKFPALKIASIGPETSKAVRALGLEPAVEAPEHTIPGLVDAIQARADNRSAAGE